jgi:hypothetical protein
MNWESRIEVPDGKIAKYQQGYNARYFKLAAQPIKHNILSDVTIKALGYNESTPRPLIIIKT